MTWIKICGTTSLADAESAVEAGADALGFIFAPSPRQISPEKAAEIIRQLPQAIEKVGVFVGSRPDPIAAVLRKAPLTMVQLRGARACEAARQLRAGNPELKVCAVLAGRAVQRELAALPPDAADVLQFLMLDNSTKEQAGGTGRPFGWKQALPALQQFARAWKIVIAGGLTAENVGEAIGLFHPFGVDVVSGVESSPGVKDAKKLKAFVAAVRAATGL